MLIRKKIFETLLYRIGETEKAIEEHDDTIALKSDEIEELKSRIMELEDISGKIEEAAKKEQNFFEGFTNIMNYEVVHSAKQTE